jgi:hypothetical protein
VSTHSSEEVDVVGVYAKFFGSFAGESVFASNVVFNVGSAALEVHAGSEKGGSVSLTSLVPSEGHDVVGGVVLDSESHEVVFFLEFIVKVVGYEVFVAESVGSDFVTAAGSFFAVFTENHFGVRLNSGNDHGVFGVFNLEEVSIEGKNFNEVFVRSHTESFTLGSSTEVETSEYGGKSGGFCSSGVCSSGVCSGGASGGGTSGSSAGSSGASGGSASSGSASSGSTSSGVSGLIGVVTTNERENSYEHSNYHHERKNLLHDLVLL